MTDQGIPEDVKQLIIEKIDSVAELEAILLLRGNREEEWTAERVGARLYISPALAATVLRNLHGRGFFELRTSGEQLYRYAPRPSGLELAVDKLAEVYRHRLVGVTNLIHSKPGLSLRKFTDAFRLRKDP
ncbi:MAG: hypothetical protein HY690_13625 [Chloroflexi bacterium]|nr:hypothetical protein [Chloroflexota bacterium]